MVSYIQEKRTRRKKSKKIVEYLVRWAAPYDSEKWDTWEPESNIYNDQLISSSFVGEGGVAPRGVAGASLVTVARAWGLRHWATAPPRGGSAT